MSTVLSVSVKNDVHVEGTSNNIGGSSEDYLLFCLSDQVYAVSAKSVQEMMPAVPVTKIVWSAAHLLGIMNLRGNIVPVMDLKMLIKVEEAQQKIPVIHRASSMQIPLPKKSDLNKQSTSSFIVLIIGNKLIAVLVDALMDVHTIYESQLRSVGAMMQEQQRIKSIACLEDKIVMVLNERALLP